MQNLLLSTYAIDLVTPIATYLTIALAVIFVTLLAVALFVKKDGLKKLVKRISVGLTIYALVLGIVMLVLEILKKYDTAYLEENWVSLDVIKFTLIPLLVTLSVALIGSIGLFVITKVKQSAVKTAVTIFGIVLALCVTVTLFLIGIHYTNNISNDGYYSKEIKPTALYISVILVIFFTLGVALFVGRSDKSPFDTRCLSLAGICVALSFALSYVKLWDMPTGGSVTLVSFLPIMLFAYIYGTKKGLLIGFLYGVLQAVQDPWLIHPAQFLLDYPVAFSMTCFAGLLTDLNVLNKLPQVKFAISALIGGTLRFLCHVLSGVFAFGVYAIDEGATNLWTYSLIYNIYVFIDIGLVILAGCLILSSKAFNLQIEKINPQNLSNEI